MKSILFVFALISASAYGQMNNSAAMAAQQAMQNAQMASQKAIASAQMSMMQAQMNAQKFNMQMQIDAARGTRMGGGFAANMRPMLGNTASPYFSVERGNVKAGTVVRIKCDTHYATIYYTTDGWTPTTDSSRYTGPITISTTTHLQAIAVGPDLVRSPVSGVQYTVDGSAASPAKDAVLVADGVLHKQIPLRLVTSAEINSYDAQVGDSVKLLLDQDVKMGDTVVAAKGTPVEALFTMADPADKRDIPGDLVFEVRSLNVAGKSITLSGGETMEGEPGKKPKEATIPPGLVVIAYVAADTPLKTSAPEATAKP